MLQACGGCLWGHGDCSARCRAVVCQIKSCPERLHRTPTLCVLDVCSCRSIRTRCTCSPCFPFSTMRLIDRQTANRRHSLPPLCGLVLLGTGILREYADHAWSNCPMCMGLSTCCRQWMLSYLKKCCRADVRLHCSCKLSLSPSPDPSSSRGVRIIAPSRPFSLDAFQSFFAVRRRAGNDEPGVRTTVSGHVLPSHVASRHDSCMVYSVHMRLPCVLMFNVRHAGSGLLPVRGFSHGAVSVGLSRPS